MKIKRWVNQVLYIHGYVVRNSCTTPIVLKLEKSGGGMIRKGNVNEMHANPTVPLTGIELILVWMVRNEKVDLIEPREYIVTQNKILYMEKAY